MRLKNLLEVAVENESPLPAKYHQLYKTWLYLGWPAFISVLIIFYLMVFKIT